MSTFLTTNKTRPGVYMNFESMSENLSSVSDRGIVVLPLDLDFLEPEKLIYVDVYTDFLSEFGISLSNSSILPIREALKNAETAIIYRLNSGVCATATSNDVVATAKYPGIYGNSLAFSITISTNDTFDVLIYADGTLFEQFNVENFDEIESLVLNFDGIISSVDKISLSGGTSNISTLDNYTKFFTAISVEDFNTLAIASSDVSIKQSAVSFVKDMRDVQGKKIQCVVENYQNADYEGVISVANGVILEDGTEISATLATCYVAGAIAGCNINKSLTYSAYLGAVDVTEKFTNSAICTKLENGEFLFTTKRGQAIIEQDINTFTSFSASKSNIFAKNRIVRVIDTLANDIKIIFEDYYLGKISNNAEGRSLFCAECINYMRSLENIDCIEDFDASSDILVESGDDLDSIIVKLNIKPVDSIEKLYMTVLLG